jgi:hypothetical protein
MIYTYGKFHIPKHSGSSLKTEKKKKTNFSRYLHIVILLFTKKLIITKFRYYLKVRCSTSLQGHK